MSEYINVEKPFLDKLNQLGWQVINQGQGVPQEPEKSLHENFKQVLLPKVFKESIKAINKTADGREWLTDKQLDEISDKLISTLNLKKVQDLYGQPVPGLTHNRCTV